MFVTSFIQTKWRFICIFFKSYLPEFQDRETEVGGKEDDQKTDYKYFIIVTSRNSVSNEFLM